MDYLLLVLSHKGEAPREEIDFAEMGKFAGELSQQGKMRGGAPLHPESAGARVSVRRGKLQTADGPFAESKEVIGGYFMFDARDAAEALEIAKRCPAARSGFVELHSAMADRAESPPSAGAKYMLIFLEGPDFGGDPDGSKYREMEKWTDELKRERKYVECAGLPKSEPGARVETRGAKVAVTDGPFAEAKEIVGGYAVVVAAARSAALELAARCPHATWGVVEVREIMSVPAM
ncbi:MAG: YciI family protein [Myxococcota bacterium]